MSCRNTAGGSASFTLAQHHTGLSEKEIQVLFHSLKREGHGLPTPSYLEFEAWRRRQEELINLGRSLSENRKKSVYDRLWRAKGEPMPDGPTFYAWSRIEARARQEVAVLSIENAVDLAPPGSQADQYEIGEDGRPVNVWYASYGSNLNPDRFMNYIEGGKPAGSTRDYPGCLDETPPSGEIPIRFAGARPHFALTSRVWNGGIAFIDPTGEDNAIGLGKAYRIGTHQFDDVVLQENGGFPFRPEPIDLDEVLQKGKSEIGPGCYETLLHIGDYDGAPVLTFTAPFDVNGAVTKTGRTTGRTGKVTIPVRTNKPSPAYLQMIGSGLGEAFGMDEVAQADYLRGCPGGDQWSRKDMVAIMRGSYVEPTRYSKSWTSKGSTTTSTTTVDKNKPSTGTSEKKAPVGYVSPYKTAESNVADNPGTTQTSSSSAPAFRQPSQSRATRSPDNKSPLEAAEDLGLFPPDTYQTVGTSTPKAASTAPGKRGSRRGVSPAALVSTSVAVKAAEVNPYAKGAFPGAATGFVTQESRNRSISIWTQRVQKETGKKQIEAFAKLSAVRETEVPDQFFEKRPQSRTLADWKNLDEKTIASHRAQEADLDRLTAMWGSSTDKDERDRINEKIMSGMKLKKMYEGMLQEIHENIISFDKD